MHLYVFRSRIRHLQCFLWNSNCDESFLKIRETKGDAAFSHSSFYVLHNYVEIRGDLDFALGFLTSTISLCSVDSHEQIFAKDQIWRQHFVFALFQDVAASLSTTPPHSSLLRRSLTLLTSGSTSFLVQRRFESLRRLVGKISLKNISVHWIPALPKH